MSKPTCDFIFQNLKNFRRMLATELIEFDVDKEKFIDPLTMIFKGNSSAQQTTSCEETFSLLSSDASEN